MDPVAELAECKEMWNEARQEAAKLAYDLLDITAERDALRDLTREALDMARRLNTPMSLNGRFICAQCGAGDGAATHIRHYAHCAYTDLANRANALLATSERAEKGEGR